METVDKIGSSRILIKILKVAGLWQWTDNSQSYQILQSYYRYLLHLPLTFTYVTLMWIEVITSSDLAQAGDVLYISLTELALVVKVVNIWHFRSEAWQFMNELTNNSKFALRTDDERVLWRSEQLKFGRVVLFYLTGCIAVAGTAFLYVLLLSTYELPFAYWVPFEWRKAGYYWFAYSYGVVAMSFTCISNAVLDLTSCYFMFHVALLYKLIGVRLASLQLLKEKDALKELRGIFELHESVKSLTLQCERLVSAPVLSQILLSAFILCFSGYRLQNVRITDNPGQFFAMLQFVSVMILEIFLPCYYANEITINSNHLTMSIYSSDWFQFSVSTRKLIYQYMEFLKRPAKIKAGNFFEVGLPIFTKTINNAYSFFAVLINVAKE